MSKNDPVTLFFTNPASYTPTTADWVGFYCSDDLESIPDRGYYDFAYTESPNSLTIAMNSGRQSECEFRFFTQSGDNKYCRTGVSDRIQVADAKTAISHRHLALTEDPTEMRISWTAGGDSAPAVRYVSEFRNARGKLLHIELTSSTCTHSLKLYSLAQAGLTRSTCTHSLNLYSLAQPALRSHRPQVRHRRREPGPDR